MKTHRFPEQLCFRIFLLTTIFFMWGPENTACRDHSGETDDRLLSMFIQGDTDSLRGIIDSIPEETAAGQFFRGVYETDGEAARFYFDRTVALYPGSPFSAHALNRLWQYHMAKGDFDMAEKYWGFLKRRHPEFEGLSQSPDPRSVRDLTELSVKSAHPMSKSSSASNPQKNDQWTVQLGAYQNHKGAQKVGQIAQKWGNVRYIKKVFKGRELTVVQVGLFDDREKAVNLDSSIRASTDLRGRIVKVQR